MYTSDNWWNENPACALFIDLTAAFCHLDKDLVFKTVCQRQTPTWNTKLIQLMESPYSYNTTVAAQTPDNTFELPMGIQ